jgi:hypothetical protein
MPTIAIDDLKTYKQAIIRLVERGGMFRTRDPQELVISPGQYDWLQQHGITGRRVPDDEASARATNGDVAPSRPTSRRSSKR